MLNKGKEIDDIYSLFAIRILPIKIIFLTIKKSQNINQSHD